MSEINQTLGFDASGAISALQQLDGAMARLNQTTANLAKSFSNLNGVTAPATKALTTFGTATNTAASQATTGLNKLSGASERLTVSWGLVARVITTQAVVSTFGAIRRGAREAAKDFGDFEKKLADIRSIDATANLDQLATSSKQLSNSFGIDLLDVAQSRLEIVSAGFSNAADQQKIFTSAAKLAKVGVASQQAAVDLLTTSLNAFGASASESDRFARSFFAAVDKGKLNVDDLAKSFGRVAPQAKALGVEVEEALALFSTLTTKGTNPAETATQIGALLSSLTKPSEELQRVIESLGASSGQELIRLRGFSGALQAIINSAGGSAAALGKIFPNVRAIRGAMSLANDQFATFQDHLRNSKTLAAGDFEARFLKRMEIDSEKASQAMNRLSNAVTVGLGQGLNRAIANMDRLLNRTGALTKGVETFFRVASGDGLAVLNEGLVGIARNSAELKSLDQFAKDWLKFTADAAKDSPELIDGKQIAAFDSITKKGVETLREMQSTLGDDTASVTMRAIIANLSEMSQQADVTAADLRPIKDEIDRLSTSDLGAKEFGSLGDVLGVAQRTMDALDRRTVLVADSTRKMKDNTSQTATAAQQVANGLNNAGLAAQKLQAVKLPTAQELGRSIVAGDLTKRVIQAGEKPLEPGQQPDQKAQKLATNLQLANTNTRTLTESTRQLTETGLTPANTSATNLNTLLQQGGISTQQMTISAQQLVSAGLQPAEFSANGVNFALQQAQLATQLAVGAAQQLAAAFQLAASAAASIKPPAAPTATATAQFGRYFAPSYFANGGRGTDTIPALLSAGEFVINAKSAREFFPQLQAMNAGQTPIFRESGGSVTNVGDINVSVKGGETGKQTARTIAAELQRELRRNTIRKF